MESNFEKIIEAFITNCRAKGLSDTEISLLIEGTFFSVSQDKLREFLQEHELIAKYEELEVQEELDLEINSGQLDPNFDDLEMVSVMVPKELLSDIEKDDWSSYIVSLIEQDQEGRHE